MALDLLAARVFAGALATLACAVSARTERRLGEDGIAAVLTAVAVLNGALTALSTASLLAAGLAW